MSIIEGVSDGALAAVVTMLVLMSSTIWFFFERNSDEREARQEQETFQRPNEARSDTWTNSTNNEPAMDINERIDFLMHYVTSPKGIILLTSVVLIFIWLLQVLDTTLWHVQWFDFKATVLMYIFTAMMIYFQWNLFEFRPRRVD